MIDRRVSWLDQYPWWNASSDRGQINHLELIDMYALPELLVTPEHKLILINKLEDRLIEAVFITSFGIAGGFQKRVPKRPTMSLLW